MPSLACGICLAVMAIAIYSLWAKPYGFVWFRFFLALLATVGVLLTALTPLVALLDQLSKKRWKKALAVLLTLPFLTIEAWFMLGLIITISMMPGGDNFAENLTIPDNIEIAEPIERERKVGSESDALQKAMVAALGKVSDSRELVAEPTVTAKISNLLVLHQNSPDIFQYYLAATPAWFVSQQGDRITAIRRQQIDSNWQHENNDPKAYLSPDYDESDSRTSPSIEIKIGFFEPLIIVSDSVTVASPGETKAAKLSSSSESHYSRYIIESDNIFVEISELSSTKERVLTQTALSFIEQELAPLVTNPTLALAKALIADTGLKAGMSAIELKHLSEPGIYQINSWLNPGEAGSVYLKAFEITKDSPLSESGLREASEERIGWSDNPDELFLMNTNFNIHEGEPGEEI